MRTDHTHAAFCPNCGQIYATTISASHTTNQGVHTHSYPLAPEVVKEFAAPDPDADLTEWRKKHVG